MKKNVIIGILVLVALVSLAYGFVQNAAAVKSQKAAEALKVIADANAEEAKKNAIEAIRQAELAKTEAEIARRCEAECAKKK